MVVGRVPDKARSYWQDRAGIPIHWAGIVPPESIPEIDRSAHALFSAELNPPCPNSVIEALACGLPIVAFDTGSLSELVAGDAGRLTPYGSDPFKMGSPDFSPLVEAAVEVVENQKRFRAAARAHAVANFGLEKMVDGYLQALVN
jgi:glycosyltransferase involved in cell wall biosynthesis